MRVTMGEHAAGEHEVFAPGCFDSQIGKKVPLRVGDRRWTDDTGQPAEATLVAYTVSEDGRSVHMTYEIPSNLAALLTPPGQGEYSIGS